MVVLVVVDLVQNHNLVHILEELEFLDKETLVDREFHPIQTLRVARQMLHLQEVVAEQAEQDLILYPKDFLIPVALG
jgi:hypothetical protein